jgi:NSS family neurotransmitter:Na+ symporter
MEMRTGSHESWSSRLAFLMAAIGAAVGLGNIWKFPYTLGSSGGSAFVVVYVVAIFVVATPIMIAEMVMGRRGRMSAPNTIRKLASQAGASRAWQGLGWMGLVAVFLVLSFFSVVAGWSLAYVIKLASGEFSGVSAADAGRIFDAFLQRPGQMIFWHGLFMAVTVYIVAAGINSGIEKAVNVLMPGLFLILAGLVIYALMTPGAGEALEFLFVPDFSKLTGDVLLAAVGQAFFSVNVGIGAVLTYSAYLPAKVNIPRSAAIIALGDTAVALLAGLVIFPIVFSNGLDPASGPGLIFVTLSAAFATMPGGSFVGAVFFIFVFVAALTSSIAMMEMMVSRAEEIPRASRKGMAYLIGLTVFLFGLLTVFSQNIWADVKVSAGVPGIGGLGIFDVLDFIVTKLLLPVGGMLYAVFAGWVLSSEEVASELGLPRRAHDALRFVTRYVAPGAIAIIFIRQLF